MADSRLKNLPASDALAGGELFYADNGSADVKVTAAQIKAFANAGITLTPDGVGLGNVTNDAQTKAAIVPNTAPSAGQVLVGTGTAYVPKTVSGDATLGSTGALTVTKTGGVAFGAAATKNVGTTSGTVAAGDDSRFSLIFTPEQYSCVGDGSDEGAKLVNMANAAKAAATLGAKVQIQLSKVYGTSQRILIDVGGISVVSVCPGAGFKPLGTAAFDTLSFSGAIYGSTVAITANYTYGTYGQTLQVASLNVPGATPLAVGDGIQVMNDTGVVAQDARGYFTKIAKITGTGPYLITPAEPVPFSIASSRSATITKITMLRGVRVEGVYIDGSVNPNAGGVKVVAAENPVISDIFAEGLNGPIAYGAAIYAIYGGRIRNVRARKCGNAAGNNGIVLTLLSRPTDVEGVIINECEAPGIGINWCSAAFRNIQAHLVVNNCRNIKIFGSCGWTCEGIQTTGGDTAIAIESGSLHFYAGGLIATGANVALWFNGTGNGDCYIDGFIGRGNGVDISIGAVTAGSGGYLASAADLGVVFGGRVIASNIFVTPGAGLDPVIPVKGRANATFSGGLASLNPTGFSTAEVIRLIGTNTPQIYGMKAGWVGRRIFLYNINTDPIQIFQGSGFAAPGEAFEFAKTLAFGEGVWAQYDENGLWYQG